MGYVLKNSDYQFYLQSDMSPRIRAFVAGLDSGSAPLNWSLLEAFRQADGTIFRLLASWRSYDTQCSLYSKGRLVTKAKETEGEKYRYKILTDKIVYPSAVCTYAFGGKSYHNFGLAVDIVVRAIGEIPKDSGVERAGRSWSSVEEFYKEVGLIAWAEKCGLSWGGFWTKPYDPVHFEDEHYSLPLNPWNTQCNFSAIAGDSVGVESAGAGEKSFGWLWLVLLALGALAGLFWG